MLDYDGTLAPFRVKRDAAFPYPGLRKILNRIVSGTQSRLIIVTGRSVDDINPLLDLQSFPEIWGAHGLERLLPDGSYEAGTIDVESNKALEELWEWVLGNKFQENSEKKTGGMAFHWRGLRSGLKESFQESILDKWDDLSKYSGLIMKRFDGGIEFRVKGQDKGLVVKTILSELGPGAAVAYLGDDLTDEDAFMALKSKGCSILVRTEFRATAADLWLKPPEELILFLKDWIRICDY